MLIKRLFPCALLLPLFFLCSVVLLRAQPVNDDPCGAIDLPVIIGTNCTPTTPLSWTDATATPGLPFPGCGSYTTGDVWFRFELLENSDVFISTAAGNGAGAITDGAMALYFAEDCNGPLNRLLCDDDNGPGSMPQIQFNGLPAGQYYIRFWDYFDKTSANFGGICVAAQAFVSNTPNDTPCDALEIPVVSADSCAPDNPQSWVGAVTSPQIELPNCGSYLTGDVWFKFTLTDTSDVAIFTTPGVDPNAITDGAMALYGADSCNGTFTVLACNNNNGSDPMPRINYAVLPPATYYIRFWDTADKITGNIGGLCVAIQPSNTIPVINDDPCGAIELVVENDTFCTPQTPLEWSNATPSPGLPAPLCGTYSTGDIWFSFTLTEASDIMIVTAPGTGVAGITDGAMILYRADTCTGTLVFVLCDDDSGAGNMPQINLPGMPAGKYFIRFWDYDDKTSGNIGGICVAALPTQSTVNNDLCFTAQPFPVIPVDGSCATVGVNTIGATGAPLNNCGGIADDDVWYTFVVPPNTTKVGFGFSQNGLPVQQGIRVYSGTCAQLISVDCFIETEGVLENLNPGQSYIIRTFTPADDDGAQYDLCLSVPKPPVNDDPCGALVIPVEAGLTCEPDDPQSWQFASPTAGIDDPGCASYLTGDVWFKFTLDFKADVRIRTAAGTGPSGIEDAGMALYYGSSCSQLIKIVCNDDQSAQNFMPEIHEFALIPGDYYIRIWDFYDKINANIGGLCVAAKPSISVLENDICLTAQPFPPLPADGSCATLHINTELATGTQDAQIAGFPDDDLWYSFTTPAGTSTVLYEITPYSGNSQIMFCVYDSCGAPSFIQCFYGEQTGRIDNLFENTTYKIRVFSYEQEAVSDFDFCLKLPPAPPANDVCAQAVPFPAIPLDGSCATVLAECEWSINQLLDCNGYESGDVWFSFTVPANTTSLTASFDIPEGSNAQPAFQILSGACNALTALGCYSDDLFESLRIDNLVPGATYWLRAYTYNSQGDKTYSICLSVPTATPPPNDVCANAIPFPPVPSDGSCASVIVNTLGATGDNDDACIGIFDDDVWFSFVVPPGYTSLLAPRTILSGTPFDALAVYSGDCNNLSLVSCHVQNDSLITGLQPGATYFIRAYSMFANDTANFEICLHVPPVTSQPNDDCLQATAFPPVPTDGTWSMVSGSTMSATPSGLPPCEGYADDDVWYTFTVPPGYDKLLFNATVSNEYYDHGLNIEVFAGDCNNLQFLGCYDENTTSHFDGLTGGSTYYLRTYSGAENVAYNFSLELAVPIPALNDDCEHATQFPDLPTDGSCIEIHGNTALATGVSDPGCIGSEDDDLWYKFTAPADRTAIHFDMRWYFGAYLNLSTYAGTCGNLQRMECFSIPYVDDASVLTPGETYYIQVFTGAVNVSGDFGLCLSGAPLPPANDNCNTATSITGAPGVFEDPGIQTLAGATLSNQPMCVQFALQNLPFDVWYSFTTDEDGGDALVTVTGLEEIFDFGYYNIALQGFSGDCQAFTTLWCGGEYNDAQVVQMPLYGLQGNTVYYFRVFGSTVTGGYVPQQFSIYAAGSALSPVSAVEELNNELSLQAPDILNIYPSPASHSATLEYSTPEAGDCQIILSDLTGKTVWNSTVQAISGLNIQRMNLSGLPQGLFIVTIRNASGSSRPQKLTLLR